MFSWNLVWLIPLILGLFYWLKTQDKLPATALLLFISLIGIILPSLAYTGECKITTLCVEYVHNSSYCKTYTESVVCVAEDPYAFLKYLYIVTAAFALTYLIYAVYNELTE